MTMESTAYHEAGHAIMHVVRGVPMDLVTIVSNDDYNGVCRWNHGPSIMLTMNMGNTSRAYRELAIDSILISLSGAAAEERFSGRYDKDGAEDDMNSAYNVAVYYSRNPDKYLSSKFGEARKIIRDNWRQVDLVAKALLEQKTLTWDDVLNLLGKGV